MTPRAKTTVADTTPEVEKVTAPINTRSAPKQTPDKIGNALFTLSAILFISALILSATIYAGAKMLETKLSNLPAAPALAAPTAANQPAPTPTAPTAKDTSLSYIGGSLTVNSADKPSGTTPTTENVPFIGNKDAKVTIVEYSDYECPYCKKFFDTTIKQLEKDYIATGKVKFIYKDFPLHSIHPQSLPAANAARCAGAQNKYYEMHNALFGMYDTWTNATNLKDGLVSLSKAIGLNETEFTKCLLDYTYKNDIQKDYTEGYYLGVRGTPTTFINGKMLATPDGDSLGAVDYATLKAEIDKLL